MNTVCKPPLRYFALLAIVGFSADAFAAVGYELPSGDEEALIRLASGRQYYKYGDVLVPTEIVLSPESAFGGTSWPGGLVYFQFDSSVSLADQQFFVQTVAQWENVAGVKFIEDATQPNRILVQNASGIGCGASNIGMIGGVQDITIGCWFAAPILHEVGHALGLNHEQQRTDRDTYVSIQDFGVASVCGQETFDVNFGIVSGTNMLAYDYASIMHYASNIPNATEGYFCGSPPQFVYATIAALGPQPPGAPPGSENVCSSPTACEAVMDAGQIDNEPFPLSARDGYGMALRYGALPSPAVVEFAPPQRFDVGSGPYDLVAGDFNGDGKPDLMVSDYDGNSVLALLSGGFGLEPQPPYSASPNPLGIVAGDFNHDGNLDIAVADHGGSSIQVLLGNGSGSFSSGPTITTGSAPYGLAVGDFDHDGNLDIIAANELSNTVSVFLGHGDGSFLPMTPFPANGDPTWIAVGDFNGDGALDLAITNSGGTTVSVFLGNGDGTFQSSHEYTTGVYPVGIAASDIDGDGTVDLIVANNASNSLSVLLGKGDGTFEILPPYGPGYGPWGVAVADMNGDGWPDIVVTNFYSNSVSILLGNRYHTFQTTPATYAVTSPLGLVVADFDGDGLPDLAVTSASTNSVTVLLNKTAADRIFANGFELN